MNPDKAKRLLRSVNDYKADIDEANERLDDIWYQLTGVKGVRFDSVRGTDFNDYKKVSAFEDQEADIRKWEKVRAIAQANLSRVNSIIVQLDEEDRECVIQIYVNGESYEKIAQRVHMSVSGLYAKLERALIRVI